MKFILKSGFFFCLLAVISCNKTVNYDKEREYFNEENGIVYYKGSPFSGTLLGHLKKSKYKDGKLDAEEREIYLEDRRRRMEDEDAKRDAQRNMTWFALSGMVLYPAAILLCSLIGMETAAMLIADIANIYVVSVSALVGAYFGFNAIGAKK